MPIQRLTVSIKMKPYLKAFMLHVYGNEPIYIPKQDYFNKLIAEIITKTPADYKYKPSTPQHLEIILPYYDYMDIRTYNFLSERAQRVFENKLQDRFWVTYESFMDKKFVLKISIIDAIGLFVEEYQLPYTSQLEATLQKRIYRSRYFHNKRRKRKYKKTNFISSDK